MAQYGTAGTAIWAAILVTGSILGGSAYAHDEAGTRMGGAPSAYASSEGNAGSAAGASANAAAASEQANSGAREVQGRIERIDRADNVTIAGSERVGLAFDQFKLDEGTEIVKEGARASIAEVNEGDEVRASLSRSGQKLHVKRLEILPRGSSENANPAQEGTAR